MNYSHIFHAGNFADVIKHVTLIICLERLAQKDAPFFVLDMHSGRAKYDLQSEEALKTGEFLGGIYEFFSLFTSPSFVALSRNPQPVDPIEIYTKILTKINKIEKITKPNDIKFYPGSPYVIKHFLRPQDRAIFCEIKKSEFLLLKKNLAGSKKITFSNEDGFALTKSKLPPIEKRGLILIDPAFEKNSDQISKDYDKTIESLQSAQKRFTHGIYLVWYPIINKENEQNALKKFENEIKDLKFKEMLRIIYKNGKKDDAKMNSCGVFVINPVFGLKEKLQEIFGKNVEFA